LTNVGRAGGVFDAGTDETGIDLHGDPLTLVNVGMQFDDPTVNTHWFSLIKSDLAEYRGTPALPPTT
jgi:hypothetical protein